MYQMAVSTSANIVNSVHTTESLPHLSENI